jgi:diguanylate cyclase (GGDEF)-like protein
MDYRTLLVTYVALMAAYTLLACALVWHDKRIRGLVLVSWGLILRLATLVLQGRPAEVPSIFTVMLAHELYLASFVLLMLGMRWFVIRTPLERRWPLMLLVPLAILYTALYLLRVPKVTSIVDIAEIVVCGTTVRMLLGITRGAFRRVSRCTAAFLSIELLFLIYRAAILDLAYPISWKHSAVQYGPGWLYSVMLMMSLSACLAACNLCFFVTEKRNELIELASTDPLTGALNRRGLNFIADIEIARSLRSGHAMSMLLLDIDRFKQVNDLYGHSAGDAALKFLVARIRSLLRSHDILARTGGDEFIVLLPETGKEDVTVVANRLCRSLEKEGLMYERRTIQISVSIGVAWLEESDPNFETLVRKADEAMYAAKRLGGNRLRVYAGNDYGSQTGVLVHSI